MPDPLGLIPNSNAAAGVQRAGMPLRTAASNGAQGPNFKDTLMSEIQKVNQLQQDAQDAVNDLWSGKRNDSTAVLMAQAKAELAFQSLLQVRNKLMDAFEEIKQVRV